MGALSVEKKIVIFCVLMVLLTGLALFLRFCVRAKQKASYSADDWWALGSLIVFYVASSFILWGQ